MDDFGNTDLEVLQRKGRRATRAAIIFLFLLAFLWSVNNFFIWLFLGAAIYSLFLKWYYYQQTIPLLNHDEPVQPTSTSGMGEMTNSIGKRIMVIFIGLLSITMLAVMVKMSFSPTVTNEDTPENTKDSDSRVDQSDTNTSGHIDSLTNLGNDFYNQAKYDSSLAYYDKVLALDAGNQFVLYDKALVYYSKKDYEAAFPIVKTCIRLYPDYAEPQWLLGDLYYNKDNLDSAKICFARAYQKGLRNGVFLQFMASLYENQDKSKATQLYKESLQQDSTLTDGYRKLAELDEENSQEYLRLLKKWSK